MMARILVADDNMDSLFCVRTILRAMGNDVMEAHDGLAACTMTKDLDPEVVLMDYKMPKIDGKQAADHIRDEERKERKHRLLIEVTGQPDAPRGEFDHVLKKPLNFKQLLETCFNHGYNINPKQMELAILE